MAVARGQFGCGAAGQLRQLIREFVAVLLNAVEMATLTFSNLHWVGMIFKGV